MKKEILTTAMTLCAASLAGGAIAGESVENKLGNNRFGVKEYRYEQNMDDTGRTLNQRIRPSAGNAKDLPHEKNSRYNQDG